MFIPNGIELAVNFFKQRFNLQLFYFQPLNFPFKIMLENIQIYLLVKYNEHSVLLYFKYSSNTMYTVKMVNWKNATYVTKIKNFNMHIDLKSSKKK